MTKDSFNYCPACRVVLVLEQASGGSGFSWCHAMSGMNASYLGQHRIANSNYQYKDRAQLTHERRSRDDKEKCKLTLDCELLYASVSAAKAAF